MCYIDTFVVLYHKNLDLSVFLLYNFDLIESLIVGASESRRKLKNSRTYIVVFMYLEGNGFFIINTKEIDVLFRMYIGFCSFLVTFLCSMVVLCIRRYVRLVQCRCQGRTQGFIDISSDDFSYAVDDVSYIGRLRPCHTQIGWCRVHYNLTNCMDAYVAGDWNDLHYIHDSLMIAGVLFCLFGWIISIGI